MSRNNSKEKEIDSSSVQENVLQGDDAASMAFILHAMESGQDIGKAQRFGFGFSD